MLQENLDSETLHKQFQIVKEKTNLSHVMEYGDPVRGERLARSQPQLVIIVFIYRT